MKQHHHMLNNAYKVKQISSPFSCSDHTKHQLRKFKKKKEKESDIIMIWQHNFYKNIIFIINIEQIKALSIIK